MANRSIGVDIGGTSIKFGVVDTQSGTVLQEFRKPTPEGVGAVVNAVVAGIRELSPDSRRVGVGVPGAMDRDRRLVRYPPNLKGWHEVPLRELLEEQLPDHKIAVDNDAKVATLAEARLGAGRGLSHFLLVTLGTGVGGGLWMDEFGGSGIVRGAGGGAGEFGHVSININGPLCGCGSRGCIEAYLGNSYLSRRTEEKLLRDPNIDSVLRGNPIDPLAIAKAMESGDEFARSVFEEAGHLLGFACSGVVKLLDVLHVIVGGGVADAGDALIDATQRSLRENVFSGQREQVEVRRAQFGNHAGMIGAALLAAAN